MKFFLSTTCLVACITISGCGRPPLLQGSGTTGLLPFSNGSDQTERIDGLRIYSLEQTMIRWNVAAEGVTIPGPLGTESDLLWDDENQFPYPTFKGGSAEAYEKFSSVFVRFFDTGDNLAYLKSQDLLDVPLLYIMPGGNTAASDSFRDLATRFSSADYSYLISEQMRNELRRILLTM